MGQSQFMKPQISADDFFRDPCSLTVFSQFPAIANNLFKLGVDFNLKVLSVEHIAHALRDFEVLKPKNASFFRSPPQDGVIFTVPRKDATFVSGDEARLAQIATYSQQSLPGFVQGREADGAIQHGYSRLFSHLSSS